MFVDFLNTLFIVQSGLESLRSAGDSLAVTTKEDLDIVRRLSLSESTRIQDEAFRMLISIKDETLKRFPGIREEVAAVSPDSMRVVDYEVHELLTTYVGKQLKERFPSILGVNLSETEIPFNVWTLCILPLGAPAIVFADKTEAEKCLAEIPQYAVLRPMRAKMRLLKLRGG